MKKVRITISHNPDDPADDLRCAARVRRELWARSPAEIDPDSPRHGTHRDAGRNAYFEFTTNYFDEVRKVLEQNGNRERVIVEVIQNEAGPACLHCGVVTGPVLPSVCPNCHFRDISPCPHCHQEIARQSYVPVTGDLFTCPACGWRVRLEFHDPLSDVEGHYHQPVVVVEPAG